MGGGLALVDVQGQVLIAKMVSKKSKSNRSLRLQKAVLIGSKRGTLK